MIYSVLTGICVIFKRYIFFIMEKFKHKKNYIELYKLTPIVCIILFKQLVNSWMFALYLTYFPLFDVLKQIPDTLFHLKLVKSF